MRSIKWRYSSDVEWPLTTPNYPICAIVYRLSYHRMWVELQTSNLVDRLIVVSASHGWQTIIERGVVKSREPFKFWRSSAISPERLKRACRLCQDPA